MIMDTPQDHRLILACMIRYWLKDFHKTNAKVVLEKFFSEHPKGV